MAGDGNSRQVLPNITTDSTQAGKPLTEESATQSSTVPNLGWSWGAFFLTWLWMAGNKVWKVIWTLPLFAILVALLISGPYFQLFALIPIFYLIVANILGKYGKRWAWESGRRWESPEHFNRVQKKWGQTGFLVVLSFSIFCVVAVWQAINSFNQAEFRVARNGKARSSLRALKGELELYHADRNEYPLSLDKLDYKVPQDIILDCFLSKEGYECTTAHKEGTRQYFTSYSSGSVTWLDYKAGNPVKARKFVIR